MRQSITGSDQHKPYYCFCIDKTHQGWFIDTYCILGFQSSALTSNSPPWIDSTRELNVFASLIRKTDKRVAADVRCILRAPVYLQISRRHRHNGWFNSHLTLQSPHTPDANKRHCAFSLKSTEIICFWRQQYKDKETRGNNIKENGQSTPPLSFYCFLREIQLWKTTRGSQGDGIWICGFDQGREAKAHLKPFFICRIEFTIMDFS